MNLACPSCHFENPPGSSQCDRCGLPFLVSYEPAPQETPEEAQPLADLDSTPGFSAGFLQLNDIALAASANRLDAKEVVDLLEELRSYLQAEERKFAGYPEVPEQALFGEGIQQVAAGLAGLRELVDEALQSQGSLSATDWASLLEDGVAAEVLLRRGVELLDQTEG